MWRRLLENPLSRACLLFLGLLLFAGIFADWLPLNNPIKVNIGAKFKGVSFFYPLGTDHLGRCVLSRLIYGIRYTVVLSLLTTAGTLSIGVFLGLTSGCFKGRFDDFLMRVCDVMLSFPSQVMILAVVGVLGPGVENVVFANIAVRWAWYVRMIRGAVVRHVDKGYVLFSRAVGSGNFFILSRHLFPAVASEIFVLASLDTGWVILGISSLSFLGLGVQAPAPEWGAMLSEARNFMVRAPLQALAPGFAVMCVVGAFNFLGDGLRDASDPKTFLS